MNKLSFGLLILVFAILPVSGISVEQNRWSHFLDVFTELSTKLEAIGEDAEKGFLRDRLSSLHQNLYQIEYDKRYLIETGLKENQMSSESLERLIRKLKKDVESSRQDLRKIGSRISQVESDASNLSRILFDALISRKSWLGELTPETFRKDKQANKEIIEDGEQAVKALSKAREQLSKLMHELE